MIYRDRVDAGKQLAKQLTDYAGRDDLLVLALPRGGVPVAYEVAKALRAPMDIFLVRKLGVPGHEELAMGAISTGGVRVLNDDVVDYLRIPGEVIDAVAADELKELERRERAYRGDRPEPDVRGKTVILIDDGLATGSTMRAAAAALRQQTPARIVVAVPVVLKGLGSFRSQRRKPAMNTEWESTKLYARKRRSRFSALACGMKTFRRRLMTRFVTSSRKPEMKRTRRISGS